MNRYYSAGVYSRHSYSVTGIEILAELPLKIHKKCDANREHYCV